MQQVECDGLLLVPMTAAHAEILFALLADPDLYRHVDESPPPSIEHLRQVYARREARQSPDGSQAWLNWVVMTGNQAQAGQAVGYVQATIMADRSAWVGYMLGRAHWHRGLASKAVQAMLPHLASAYDARGFLATVEVDNHRSIALLCRLGFRPATADEAEAHDLTPTERLYLRTATGLA